MGADSSKLTIHYTPGSMYMTVMYCAMHNEGCPLGHMGHLGCIQLHG